MRKVAFDVDAEGFRLVLRERLRSHHVLHLAGSDAERQSAQTRRACWYASRRRRSSCPAWSAPSSGPIMCTMPCSGACTSYSSTPKSAQFCRSALTWRAAIWSTIWSRSATARRRHVVVHRGDMCGPAGAACGPPCADRRRPAGSSPHGPGAGRCTGSLGSPRRGGDQVLLPYFFEHRVGHASWVSSVVWGAVEPRPARLRPWARESGAACRQDRRRWPR